MRMDDYSRYRFLGRRRGWRQVGSVSAGRQLKQQLDRPQPLFELPGNPRVFAQQLLAVGSLTLLQLFVIPVGEPLHEAFVGRNEGSPFVLTPPLIVGRRHHAKPPSSRWSRRRA